MFDPQETFGDRLAIAIKMAGLNQRTAAEQIGITEVSMSRYIKNKRRPTVDILVKMVRVTHSDSDWLLGTYKGKYTENDVAMGYMEAYVAAHEHAHTWTMQQRVNIMRELLKSFEEATKHDV